MNVFEKQHQQQGDIPGGDFVSTHVDLPVKHGEGKAAHDDGIYHDSFDHEAIKDGLLRISGFLLQLVAFLRFEDQGNILDAIGDQV